jgi:CelD/BcsL family acetyltransferase involved in cellulose biosynthesis
MTLEIKTSTIEVEQLEHEWESLLAASTVQTPFLGYEWTRAWCSYAERLEPRTGARILLLRTADRVTSVFPLMVRQIPSGLPVRKLEWLGGQLIEAGEFACAADLSRHAAEIANHFWLSDDWELMELWRFRASDPALEALESAFRARGFSVRRVVDGAIIEMPLENSWEEQLKGRSKATRHTFQTQSNRLARGGFRVQILDRVEDDSLWDAVFSLEHHKEIRAAAPWRYVPAYEQFFRDFFRRCAHSRRLYLATMRKEAELVAFEIGFCQKKTLWVYSKGFDPRYRYYSPGTMLIPYVIDYGRHRGCDTYVLGQRAAYKLFWSQRSLDTVTLQIWRPTLWANTAARLYFMLRPRLKHLAVKFRDASQAL